MPDQIDLRFCQDHFSGRRMQEFRISQGLTQEQLAAKVNTGQNTISDWENGKKIPSMLLLFRLVTALNVPPRDLTIV